MRSQSVPGTTAGVGTGLIEKVPVTALPSVVQVRPVPAVHAACAASQRLNSRPFPQAVRPLAAEDALVIAKLVVPFRSVEGTFENARTTSATETVPMLGQDGAHAKSRLS